MNNDLLAALRLLAQPGATLTEVDFGCFGFSAPLRHLDTKWQSFGIAPAIYNELAALDYLTVITQPKTWKVVYQANVGGLLALAEAEKEAEHEG